MMQYLNYGWTFLIVFFINFTRRSPLSSGARLPAENGCTETVFPPEIRRTLTQRIPNFQPFRFRANNYGLTKYTLHGFYEGHLIPNIKIGNSARPDTLTGRDLLGGFYAFYQSFFVTRKMGGYSNHSGRLARVHSIDAKEHALEMWNIYKRKISKNSNIKSGTVNATNSGNLISVNVLFEVGNKSLPRLNPFISAMEKLSLQNSFAHSLPYNYDPYALLPHKSSFLIYSSNVFPFPYPENISLRPKKQGHNIPIPAAESDKTKIQNKIPVTEAEDHRQISPLPSKSSCKTSPFIKIYIFETSLIISDDQLKRIEYVERNIRGKYGDGHDIEDKDTVKKIESNDLDPDHVKIVPKIYETSSQESILLRRSIAPASASIISTKIDGKGEPDSEPYPMPDCNFIHYIQPIMRDRAMNHGNRLCPKSTSYYNFTIIISVVIFTIRYLFCRY